MPQIVDIHCHVLPGVDDGPRTMEDSLAILREATKQGIDAMIVTPHFHPGRYKVYADQIHETLRAVNAELRREENPIRLIPGQECYYYSGLVRELEAGRVLTMAGTRYVLVEFEPDVLYSMIQHALRDLINSGYKPIVAHYERYRCLYNRTERLDELHNQGAMLQLNFDRLLERDSFLHRNVWRRQLKDGYVDFLGSDTHGMGFRPLHVDRALDWLKTEVRPEVAGRILGRNVRRLTEAVGNMN